MSSDSDESYQIPAREVDVLDIGEAAFWAWLDRKGVSRNCRECALAPPCEILMTTGDTRQPILTSAMSMKFVGDILYYNPRNTLSIRCPNCGFIRSFSVKAIANG